LCHLDGRQKEWREHQTAENHSLNVAVKVGEAVLMPVYGENESPANDHSRPHFKAMYGRSKELFTVTDLPARPV
jgi:hypothetical protein